jgi:heat shock protein 5
MDHLIKGYKKKTGTDVIKNLRALGKLKREVEKAKRTLSSQQSVRIEIESFKDGNDFRKPLHAPSSRKLTWTSSVRP